MKILPLTQYIALYPPAGVIVFVLLSFAHDGFRTDRSLQSYYVPITVGFVVGSIIARLQTTIETRTRMYERQLSKEREDAVLGRAAASIAHEVRNPLNALAMGLQRLQMETNDLSSEHRNLLGLMLDSVQRANGIIANLLRYARPPQPQRESLRLDLLIEKLLILYGSQCRDLHIDVGQQITFREPILGDPDLLGQAVENLLRNAIEAQPHGGFLDVELKRQGSMVSLLMRNAGFPLSADEAERIFEPYFTTKVQGTGLGMPILRRIVEAHGGHVKARATQVGHVEITVLLPLGHGARPLSEKTTRIYHP